MAAIAWLLHLLMLYLHSYRDTWSGFLPCNHSLIKPASELLQGSSLIHLELSARLFVVIFARCAEEKKKQQQQKPTNKNVKQQKVPMGIMLLLLTLQ